MIENTKQNAPIQQKIKFLSFTYFVAISLWLVSAQLAGYLTSNLKTNDFIVTLSKLDIYKILLLLLVFYLSSKYLDKILKPSNTPILVLRFIAITLIICCINIRWSIDPDNSEYFTYIYKIGLLATFAQLLRGLLLIYTEKKSSILKRYENRIPILFFSLFLGIVLYLVFTITERISQNSTILKIDKLLIDYLKYPLLIGVFAVDSAFSNRKPTAKNIPFDLYDVNISEFIKSGGIRLSLFLFIYFLIAGSILSSAMIRNFV